MRELCPGCMRRSQKHPICEHCGFDERIGNKMHQLPIGAVLKEQYIIGKVLGQGGFGITYLGWDQYLDSKIAIKEYYPKGKVMRDSSMSTQIYCCDEQTVLQFDKEIKRFMKEARALAQLNELPEIVHVRNFFTENNTAYIIMEYVDGTTLLNYVKRQGPLEITHALQILRPLMKALSLVHKAGIVHRDISPDNIMLLPDGGVKLLDFGAIRWTEQNAAKGQMPESTVAILKHGYAPPEQYQSQGDIGPWTDVYALSATLYFCLTGRVLPDATDRMLNPQPLDLTKIPGMMPHHRAAMEHGLQLVKDNRTASVDALYRELYKAERKSKKQNRSGRKWIPVVACLLLAVVGIFIFKSAIKPPLPNEMPETTSAAVQTESETVAQIATEPIIPEENMLMGNPMAQDAEGNNSYILEQEEELYGLGIVRSQVRSIDFLDTLEDMPSDAVDVSAKGNGRVMAWIEPAVEFNEALQETIAPTQSGTEDMVQASLLPEKLTQPSEAEKQELPQYALYIAAEGGVYAPEDSANLLACMPNLVSLHFGDAFHTDLAKNMNRMFANDQLLQDLDLSGFKTDNTVSMRAMFENCAAVKSLDLSGFKTDSVTDMAGLFNGCASLESIKLSSRFETGNVKSMMWMFRGCRSLNDLDVSAFDTVNVQDMSYMFAECASLTEISVKDWKTDNVKDMSSMFYDCKALERLDVSGFDTFKVENMREMFYQCEKLTEISVKDWKTDDVKDMSRMFSGCTALESLDVSGFDTYDVENMEFMFGNCKKLSALAVDNWKTNHCKNMKAMFLDCSSLERLEVSGFSTGNVEDMSFMFSGCEKITELNVHGFDTRKVEKMNCMFQSCLALENLDLSNFETAAVTNMSSMFAICVSLEEIVLDKEKFDTSGVQTMYNMFSGSEKLKSVDVSGFDTGNVNTMENMFFNCKSLENLEVKGFNTSNVTNMAAMFYNCGCAGKVKVGRFDTAKVEKYDWFMEDGLKVNGKPWQALFD